MPARFNLSAASPFGPIFGKELRVTSRRKRSYFLRFFYLAFLLLFLIFVWSVSGISSGGGAAYRQQRQAELGEVFFATFAIFCVGAMGLIGPVLTATAVSSERLHRTLPVLLMTPINSWQIIGGKLFSRMLVALTLIGLSLPVLALTRLLGGVEIEQVIGVISLATVTALTGASIGLLFSTIMRRGYAVILLSYALMIFLYMFLPLMIVLSDFNLSNRWLEQQIAALNPFFCAGMLVGNFQTRGWIWQTCVIWHVAFSASLLLVASLLLRSIARRESEGAAPIATEGALPAGSALEIVPSNPDARAKRSSSVSDNPVLWRELRRPLMNRRWQRVVGSIACVALLLITYGVLASEGDLLDNDTHIGYACVFHTVLMLLACVLSATAIAQEKEGDTWTLLLSTPMTARQIIIGKVLGTARKMLWPTALVAAHLLIFAAADAFSWGAAGLSLWVMITFNALWIATGVLLSLAIRRVTFAVVVNLMLPIILYAVTPLLLLIFGVIVFNDDDLPELTMLYLPYYYIAEGIDSISRHTLYSPIGRMSQSHFVKMTLVAGWVYLILSGIILRFTIGGFDRIVGRASNGISTANEPLPAGQHIQ